MASFLYYESDRINSILNGTNDYFAYDVGHLNYSGSVVPIHRIHDIGETAISLYGSTIDKYSAQYGVDSNLVKAIVYVENSQGWKDKFVGPLNILGYRPESALPMNIQPGTWGALLPNRGDFYDDYDANIELGVKLISEIMKRLPAGATPADIATLYNGLAKDTNSLYGVQVYDAYSRQLWNFQDGNYGEPASLLPPALVDAHCFLAGTEIAMWDGSKKPIEEITPNDWVLSHDENGNPKPGRVARTFTNEAKIILDFHGTFVTPGHVYFCVGGKYEGRFAPLIDILRDDGVVQHEDGTLIRAATGCKVGSEDDKEFWAFTVYEDKDGSERIRDKKKLRLGTRWMLPNGHHFTMREYMAGVGIELLDDGYVRFKATGIKVPFIWTFSANLPSPEDFVLARSQTTLEDIYRADQWEVTPPTMPVPLMRDSGPVTPLPERKLDAMPRNMPMAFDNESPSSELTARRQHMN